MVFSVKDGRFDNLLQSLIVAICYIRKNVTPLILQECRLNMSLNKSVYRICNSSVSEFIPVKMPNPLCTLVAGLVRCCELEEFS